MRLLDKKDSSVLWEWNHRDRAELAIRFKSNLRRSLELIRGRMDDGDPLSREELTEFLNDLMEAAGTLGECTSNCLALASTIRAFIGESETADALIESTGHLAGALGKPVVLTRTTISELLDKQLTLEEIEGANAIVRLGDDYWGTPVDRILVLPEPGEIPERQPPEHLDTRTLFLPKTADGEDRGKAVADFAGLKILQAHAKADMYLRLNRDEVGNAIQFLTLSGKEGCLELELPKSEETGKGIRLFIEGNQVAHAQYNDISGVEAVAHMLVIHEADSFFYPGKKPKERTIDLTTDQLLIEAAIAADRMDTERETP